MAVMKLCLKCSNLVDQGQKYCPKHTTAPEEEKKERNRYYDTYKRDKEAEAFYNSKPWQITRLKVKKRDNNLCVSCLRQHRLKRADVVDHIKPYEHFPELALDMENLQCLCHRCHQAKTAEDKKRYAHLKPQHEPIKPVSTNKDGYRPNITIIDEYVLLIDRS